jgi:hypothetical protein
MKTIVFVLLTLGLLVTTLSAQTRSQLLRDLRSIDEDYKEYLEDGTAMMAYAGWYSGEMDSMLNVVYRRLQATNTKEQNVALKADEIRWLKKRDALFTKMDRKLERDYPKAVPHDEQMFVWDNQAMYIRKRVLYLIHKLPK